LALNNVIFALNYTSGQAGGLSAQFSATLTIGEECLDISAVHPGAGLGWQLAGALHTLKPESKGLSLRDLAAAFHIGDQIDGLGPSLTDVALASLSISYDTMTKRFAADGIITLPDSVTIHVTLNRTPQAPPSPILGAQTAEGASAIPEVTAPPTAPKPAYDVRFSGQISVKTLTFDLVFDHTGGGDYLIGSYAASDGGENLIADLLEAVGASNADVPADLSFKIKRALIVYAKAKVAADGKTPTPPSDGGSGTGGVLFALDMDTGVDLSGLGSLPLIGPVFAGEHQLTIAFMALISSGTFPAATLTAMNTLLPADQPQLPTRDIAAGAASLDIQVRIGGEPLHLLTDPGTTMTPKTAPKGLGTPLPAPAPPATRPAADVHWIDVQKTLARVLTLHRIGVGLHQSEVTVLLDGSLAVAGLSLDLLGLGATYDMTTRTLGFMLQGMALEVHKGTLDIRAAFANLGGDFVGLAKISMQQFGLTAMGAFSQGDGHPSMFIYGALNYPIGGPVFFFVEGLALGFGYNRHLTLPAIAGVASFPFVAEAISMGQGEPPPAAPTSFGDGTSTQTLLNAELAKLDQAIYPSVGEYFVAVGLKFNSFRLIDVFALMTVQANLNTERFLISLMGVATLEMPKDSDKVLAFVELNFLVTVDPVEGSVLAQAQLTANSWVLSRDCHLSGGFAVGLWFLGEHAGDFVYTLGGYHPHFAAPRHYPTVPRLALLWNINSALTVKGDLYYALTPVAAMAGGHLSAVWEQGGLKAWFDLGIDFLIQWKPFQYEGSAYIEIGASFGPISGSIGADIDVRGPDFSGEVTFKLGPLHHTLSFGSHTPPPAVDWAEFKRSFLPHAKQQDGSAGAVRLLSLAVTEGLLNTVKTDSHGDEETWWVVNPKTFALAAATAVPFTQLIDARTQTSLCDSAQALPDAFGIAPMEQQTAPASAWHVTITHEGSGALSEFAITPILKKFP
ncbi:MAG TPA: DUF6603 domain-containing protein, partial [Herpetosiphonaceae bacterium]|nr:DUF6603 domain-containing protein [Herpetosiphonaceae bacterium]